MRFVTPATTRAARPHGDNGDIAAIGSRVEPFLIEDNPIILESLTAALLDPRLSCRQCPSSPNYDTCAHSRCLKAWPRREACVAYYPTTTDWLRCRSRARYRGWLSRPRATSCTSWTNGVLEFDTRTVRRRLQRKMRSRRQCGRGSGFSRSHPGLRTLLRCWAFSRPYGGNALGDALPKAPRWRRVVGHARPS